MGANQKINVYPLTNVYNSYFKDILLLKLLVVTALNSYTWEMDLKINGLQLEFNLATSEGKIQYST